MIRRLTDWIMRPLSRATRSFLWLVLIYGAVLTLAFGLADVIVPSPGTGLAANVAWMLVVYLINCSIVALAALWRPVFAIFLPLYVVLYTVITYFRYTLSVILDKSVIELSLGTDPATSMSMISTPLIVTVSIAFVVAVAGVIVRWRLVKVRRSRWQWAVLSAMVLTLTATLPGVRQAMHQRSPYNFTNALVCYLTSSKYPRMYRFNFEMTRATTDETELDVIFLLGESIRADHLGINGYQRQTTPRLAAERNLVSFDSIYAISYFTDRAVPRIMTRADSIDDMPAYTEQSFITLFKNAGFHTVWYGNQAETTCLRYYMYEADKLYQADWNFVPNEAEGTFLDADLLPWLDDELGDGAHKLRLHILHEINAHWVYTSKYPAEFERYKPVMTHNEVLLNSRQELINAYDNCVLYADHIWGEVIDRLRNRNAIVIYLSDHGESLGEDGKYLHGADYPPAHNTAAWVWWSDRYAEAHPDRIAALRANAHANVTSAYLFHTILDAAGISTTPLDPAQSLMRTN